MDQQRTVGQKTCPRGVFAPLRPNGVVERGHGYDERRDRSNERRHSFHRWVAKQDTVHGGLLRAVVSPVRVGTVTTHFSRGDAKVTAERASDQQGGRTSDRATPGKRIGMGQDRAAYSAAVEPDKVGFRAAGVTSDGN